ncbi:MAG: YbbR-like domain-containing protein [bacterium]
MISRLRSILLKNWIPKLSCLLIAIGLWFWVSIQQTGQAQFEVPVEFINTPSDLMVAGRTPRNVTVTLEGPKKTLFGTDSANIHARINLGGYENGRKVFWSSEIKLEHPKSLRLESISPRKIEVRLAQRSEATLDVEPTISSGPPETLEFKTSVKPDTATVFGPEQKIESLRSVDLRELDLSDLDPDTHTFARQANLPSGVNLSYPEKNSFTVRVYVYERKIQRTIKNISVGVTDVPAGMKASVEPSKIDLQVKGPISKVKGLSADDITIKVSAPDKESGQSIRVVGDADINLPDGVKRINPTGDITALRVQLESL